MVSVDDGQAELPLPVDKDMNVDPIHVGLARLVNELTSRNSNFVEFMEKAKIKTS